MYTYALLVSLCWITFVLVWAVSWFTAKRTVNSQAMARWFIIRALIFAVIILLFRSQLQGWVHGYKINAANIGPLAGIGGVVLCAAGIALAIWARVYLGRNWGMPMSVKEKPELVTEGPYSYIRHPIYAGILLAMLGTGIVIGPVWFALFVIFGAYSIYSAAQEEKLMQKTFPDTYPAYKKRTYMLVPFLFEGKIKRKGRAFSAALVSLSV